MSSQNKQQQQSPVGVDSQQSTDGEVVEESHEEENSHQSQQLHDDDNSNTNKPDSAAGEDPYKSTATATNGNTGGEGILGTDRKSFSIRAYNLPLEAKSIQNIRNALKHKFQRHGHITSSFINLIPGADPELIFTFDKIHSAPSAVEALPSLMLYTKTVHVELISEFTKEIEIFHVARIRKENSRYIHISGSEKQLQKRDVHEFFYGCGRILELSIRQRSASTSVSAQFDSFKSACAAFRVARLKNLGLKPVKKVDYEASLPSPTLIVSSLTVLPSNIDIIKFLGVVVNPMYHIYDANSGSLLIFFPKVTHAVNAMKDLNTKMVNARFFEVDFANEYTELDFLSHMDKSLLQKHMKFIQQIGFKITNKFEVLFSAQRKKIQHESLKRSDKYNSSNNKNNNSSFYSPDNGRVEHLSKKSKYSQMPSDFDNESDINSDSEDSQYSFPSEHEEQSEEELSESSNGAENPEPANPARIELKDPLHFFIQEDEIDLELKRINAEFKATCKMIDEITTGKRETKLDKLSQISKNDNQQQNSSIYKSNLDSLCKITQETMDKIKMIE